jgi:hypothetical protein
MLRAVKDASITITLELHELAKCIDHAKRIVEYYGDNHGSGVYKHNRVDSNIIGVKGEVATYKWLTSFLPSKDVVANFENFDTSRGPTVECADSDTSRGLKGGGPSGPLSSDIIYKGKTFIEVKSLRPSHWGRYRRMVPPHQLQEYVNKEAIIVWATATHDDNLDVQLRGWNFAKDVQDKGITTYTICKNVWLVDDEHMKEMGILKGALTRPFKTPERDIDTHL